MPGAGLDFARAGGRRQTSVVSEGTLKYYVKAPSYLKPCWSTTPKWQRTPSRSRIRRQNTVVGQALLKDDSETTSYSKLHWNTTRLHRRISGPAKVRRCSGVVFKIIIFLRFGYKNRSQNKLAAIIVKCYLSNAFVSNLLIGVNHIKY